MTLKLKANVTERGADEVFVTFNDGSFSYLIQYTPLPFFIAHHLIDTSGMRGALIGFVLEDLSLFV